MSNDLVFYTNPMSRGRIVRWMLEEVGRPYRTELLDYGTTMKAAEYLAINPMGKVPALRHGDTVVTEAAAICAYLADAFPEAGLAPPPTARERGAYYRALFFVSGVVEPAVVVQALGFQVPADRKPMAGWGDYGSAVDTLEKLLDGREHLAGDRFTAADLLMTAQLGWGLQTGGLPSRPAFVAFAEKHQSRPAAIRAREMDDALMPAN